MEAKVFIGSSGEALPIAHSLQALLNRHAAVKVWNQSEFENNSSIFDNLIKMTQEFDFACFIGEADDLKISRGQKTVSTRDNIIFEYGLFLGALGRERVFFLHPRHEELVLASDLLGVSLLDYKMINEQNSAENVLGPASQEIIKKIRSLGKRISTSNRRYGPILEDKRVDHISQITDAAIYFSNGRFGYKDNILNCIYTNKVIPGMYYYCTEAGAEFWIKMSSDHRYKFHNDSLRLIRSFSAQIAKHAPKHCDFISIGSGDGEKDKIILDALLSKERDIIYYPIDISDKLLVECAKKVFKGRIAAHNAMRTKAILGDFCDLSVLKSVYEDRSCANIFSVLGNTVGNSDEAQILNAIHESMFEGDLVLVEFNCESTQIEIEKQYLGSDLLKRYCSLPLEIVGVDVDPSEVNVERAFNVSLFECAASLSTTYGSAKISGRDYANIALSIDHRYNFDDFPREFAKKMDVTLLASERIGKAGILLARK